MPTYVALLRGINVGGKNLLPMADLRQHLADCGFDRVQTLLQSGNVVLDADERSAKSLEERLEAEIESRFGLKLRLMVRSKTEWESIVAANPFEKEATDDPGHLLVIFLKSEPSPYAIQLANEANKGPEYFQAKGRELFVVYPVGVGVSKLQTVSAWKKLAGEGTGRNWNTVLKIRDLMFR
jgi:uncharacterized protein (DUF1697 family)